MDIFAILEGLISGVPEAIALYNQIVPLIAPKADVSEAQVAAINELVPVAHAAVAAVNSAVSNIVGAHATAATATAAAAA